MEYYQRFSISFTFVNRTIKKIKYRILAVLLTRNILKIANTLRSDFLYFNLCGHLLCLFSYFFSPSGLARILRWNSAKYVTSHTTTIGRSPTLLRDIYKVIQIIEDSST